MFPPSVRVWMRMCVNGERCLSVNCLYVNCIIIIIKVFYRVTSFVTDLTFNRISVHIEKCVFFSKVWTLVVEFLFDVCEYVLICIFSLVKNPSTLVFCCPLWLPVELIPVKFEGWINHSKQSQCVCCRCQSVYNYHTLSHSPWR